MNAHSFTERAHTELHKKYLNTYIGNCFIAHAKSEKRQKRFLSLIQEDATSYLPVKLEELKPNCPEKPEMVSHPYTQSCLLELRAEQFNCGLLFMTARAQGRRQGFFSSRNLEGSVV